MRALASMLAANRTLRALCIGDAHFGDSNATLLAEGLRDNSTLHELDLSSCGVGPAGATALADALSRQGDAPAVAATGLQTLDLSLNPLGCAGAAAIAASIAGLRHVNLAGCDIGSEGAGALGSAVGSAPARSQQLYTLDLSSNSLGHSGGQALAAGFTEGGPSPASPTELILADTAVGDVAVEALMRALGDSSGGGAGTSTLEKLDLSRCDLQGSAAAEAVRQVSAGYRLLS